MSGVFRRALAGVATVALLAVGVQLLGTTAASAHDNHVTGVATCQQDGTYTVTWTVFNDWNHGIDTVTVNGLSPSGAALSPTTLSLNPVNTPGSTGTMTESGIPGNATNATLDVKGHWAYDGFTQPSRTGSVPLTGTCAPSKTPTAPNWANGACVAGKVTQPTITIPSDSGISYADNGTAESPGTYQAAPGSHTITAASTTVTLAGTTRWVFTLTTISGSCSRAVVPVVPSVTAIRCIDHAPTRPQLQLPTTTGVVYVPQTKAPYHAGEQVKVVAIATKGYKFHNLPSAWHEVSGNRAATTVTMPKQKNCGSSITPASPKVTETYCPVGQTHPVAPTLTLPADTAELHYRVTGGAQRSYQAGQTVKVLALANKDYYFGSVPSGWKMITDTKLVRTITFSGGPNACTVNVAPTQPGFTAEQCVGGNGKTGTYTIPATTGVVYQVNGKDTRAGTYPAPPSSTVTVVATPKQHYRLTGQTKWTHAFGPSPQCTPTTVPPTAPHGVEAARASRSTTTSPVSALAGTGVPTANLIGGGLVLLLIGGLLTLVATHRRNDGSSGS